MIKYLTAYLLLGFLVTFNLSNCPVLIYLVACLVLRRLECRACMPDLHTCFPQATRSCRGFNGTDGKDKLRTNFSTTHKLPQRAGSGGSKVHLLPLTQGWCDDQHRLQMLGSISWLRTRADSIGKWKYSSACLFHSSHRPRSNKETRLNQEKNKTRRPCVLASQNILCRNGMLPSRRQVKTFFFPRFSATIEGLNLEYIGETVLLQTNLLFTGLIHSAKTLSESILT